MAEANLSMMEQEAGTSDCSTSNPCPICLGPFVQGSYLDQCFHRFCYNCIIRWTKVVSSKQSLPPSSVKCPLCKRESFSVIHGYDGHSFQRHYISEDFRSSLFFSEAHRYRLKCYYIEPGLLNDNFNVSRYWKSHKYLQANRWLQSWLRREIQALVQEEDIDIIVHHIVGVIDSFRRNDQRLPRGMPETKQEEFKALVSEAARPFLAGRTDRFIDEVKLFLASGLTIEAYDRVYVQHLGWKVPGIAFENEEGITSQEHAPLTPYLFFFDSSSDEID